MFIFFFCRLHHLCISIYIILQVSHVSHISFGVTIRKKHFQLFFLKSINFVAQRVMLLDNRCDSAVVTKQTEQLNLIIYSNRFLIVEWEIPMDATAFFSIDYRESAIDTIYLLNLIWLLYGKLCNLRGYAWFSFQNRSTFCGLVMDSHN